MCILKHLDPKSTSHLAATSRAFHRTFLNLPCIVMDHLRGSFDPDCRLDGLMFEWLASRGAEDFGPLVPHIIIAMLNRDKTTRECRLYRKLDDMMLERYLYSPIAYIDAFLLVARSSSEAAHAGSADDPVDDLALYEFVERVRLRSSRGRLTGIPSDLLIFMINPREVYCPKREKKYNEVWRALGRLVRESAVALNHSAWSVEPTLKLFCEILRRFGIREYLMSEWHFVRLLMDLVHEPLADAKIACLITLFLPFKEEFIKAALYVLLASGRSNAVYQHFLTIYSNARFGNPDFWPRADELLADCIIASRKSRSKLSGLSVKETAKNREALLDTIATELNLSHKVRRHLREPFHYFVLVAAYSCLTALSYAVDGGMPKKVISALTGTTMFIHFVTIVVGLSLSECRQRMRLKRRSRWTAAALLRSFDEALRVSPSKRNDKLSLFWMPPTMVSDLLAFFELAGWQVGVPLAFSGSMLVASFHAIRVLLDAMFYGLCFDPLDERWLQKSLEADRSTCFLHE